MLDKSSRKFDKYLVHENTMGPRSPRSVSMEEPVGRLQRVFVKKQAKDWRWVFCSTVKKSNISSNFLGNQSTRNFQNRVFKRLVETQEKSLVRIKDFLILKIVLKSNKYFKVHKENIIW